MCFAPKRPTRFRHLNFQKWSETEMCFAPQSACAFSSSQLPEVVPEPGVLLYILTSKCSSHHNRVHFFDHLQLPKVVRDLVSVLYTFDFEMCFAPQRRALFRSSQLPKVLREWCVLYILTSKCASRHNGVHFFDHLQLPKVIRDTLVFLTLLISEMCFAPQRRAIFYLSSGQMAPHPPLYRAYFSTSRDTNHWKNTVFRDYSTFSPPASSFL